jgi:hypothetical protein
MFYVIDQGFFRRSELVDLIQGDPTASFVITDTALVEMMKGDRWDYTLRRSLTPLIGAVDRVFGAISVSEGIRFELLNNRPVDRTVLIPDETTHLIREMIAAAGGSADGAKFISQIATIRDELLREQVRPNAQLQSVKDAAKAFLAGAGQDFVSGLRRHSAPPDVRLGCVLEAGLQTLRLLLPGAADEFVSANPIVLRFTYAEIANVTRWYALGGLGTAKPVTAQNDSFDREYVVVGSYFDHTLAIDSDVKIADGELRALLSDERRPILVRAYDDYRSKLKRVS